jgi:hypothetical protein
MIQDWGEGTMGLGAIQNSEFKTQNSVRWQVRPFGEADAPGLLTLYKQVFGRERSLDDFRWKLLGRCSPVDTVWVASTAERIVGQHAGIPTWMKLGDVQVLAMHAVEAMTHPDHRREGMLTQLGGGLYGHWRSHAVPLIIGLPHPGWGSRAWALGYREVLKLQWLSRPLRPLAMLAGKLKSGIRGQGSGVSGRRQALAPDPWPLIPATGGSGVRIARRQRAGSEFDELWSLVGAAYENCVVRDAAWVQWRFLDAPGGVYSVLLAERGERPCGYIAYRLVNAGGRLIGRVADLFSHPADADAARVLLRSALAHLRRHGADSVAALVAAGSALHAQLRRQGFVFARGEYSASFIPLDDKIELSRLRDPRRWLMTGGDFDVV